jgi:triosephosphate isomerase (TIM)
LKTLVINFKNYRRILGSGSLELAAAAESSLGLAARRKVEIILCPPQPMLGRVASTTGLPVFSQSLDLADEGKSTGAVIAESVRAAGAAGTLLNHSEARLSAKVLEAVASRAKEAGLRRCVCARTSNEAGELAMLKPEYLSIEPPQLIGSGVAVSRAKPGVVTATVRAARESGYRGRILCGAGIVTAMDVEVALELGADGVLVSSSVVAAADWATKILELVVPLSSK